MKKKLTNTYLSIFCMEMSVIYRAGISPADGLRVLLHDADKDSTLVLNALLEELLKREPLSISLERSGYFPDHMIGMVKAGEATGRIVEMLAALSEYYDRLDRLAHTLKNAVFFPLILLAMMLGVVLVLVTQVLPIFNDVFERHGSRMSATATYLLRFGEWLGAISLFIAALVAAILLIGAVFWLVPALRRRTLGALRRHLGGLGLLAEIASYHFISVVALSVESGLKAKDAVELAAFVSGGAIKVDERNADCARRLAKGETLADAMGQAGILGARETHMLNFATRGGTTDAALMEITRRKERNILDKIDKITGRVEPILIISISIIVGIVLLSVMAPLMGIMNSIGR